MDRDTIYRNPLKNVRDFVFDEQVARVFDDMISRSVPLYAEAQHATASLAKRFAQPLSTVYDLGCSTGTTLVALCSVIDDPSIHIVGVDNSHEMISQCQAKLDQNSAADRIELVVQDIRDTKLENASVVILNYTLQFIPAEERLSFLKNVYQGLRPKGALLLTEKLAHRSTPLEEAFTDLYYDFKQRNGYSSLEIAQKREALENVLTPLSAEENIELLQKAGFSAAELYLKAYAFASFAALKE